MARESIPVTREGLERLKAELEELVEVRRPQIVAAVAEARSHGDLRENAAYDAARDAQAMNEKRIAEVEAMLRNAEVIDEEKASRSEVVSLGSTVVIDFDGDEETYTIVGAIESRPAEGRISNQSPMGRALLGARPGEKRSYVSPRGTQTFTVKRIER